MKLEITPCNKLLQELRICKIIKSVSLTNFINLLTSDSISTNACSTLDTSLLEF